MSDHILMFIPADPEWQPTKEDAEAAASFLRSIVATDSEVTYSFTDEIVFHHPAANWSGVECSICGTDAEDWFFDAVNDFAIQAHKNLSTITPCCEKRLSLNDMKFIWPAAFGRFSLQAINPNIGSTNAIQEKQLADTLRSPLRKVHAHW
jgi:hypothetical protein